MIKPLLSTELQGQSAECSVLSVGVTAPRAALRTQSPVLASRHLLPGTQYSRGFTLIELIIVISIIVILAGLFLIRVPFYQEQAEKAAMQQVAGAIQSALVLRYGALVTRGADNEIELNKLVTDNPINWLQQKPKNYVGEFFAPTSKAVAPGSWMFDLKTRELVYVTDHGEYFSPGNDGNKWIRFRVQLGYEPKLGRPSEKELVAVLFEPSEPYRWFD